MKIIPTRLEWNNSGLRFEAYIPDPQAYERIDIGKDLHLSEYDFPSKVIIKCAHCGQWAAVQTACKSCGAPVG